MRCRKGRIWCCACRRRIPSRREGHWHLDRRLCPRGCRRSVLGLIDVLFAEEARLCSWWRWVERQAVREELVVRALCRVKETGTAQATRGSRGMCQGRRIWCCGAWTFGSRLACIWDTEGLSANAPSLKHRRRNPPRLLPQSHCNHSFNFVHDYINIYYSSTSASAQVRCQNTRCPSHKPSSCYLRPYRICTLYHPNPSNKHVD